MPAKHDEIARRFRLVEVVRNEGLFDSCDERGATQLRQHELVLGACRPDRNGRMVRQPYTFRRNTRTIPIVTVADDLVLSGLVSSLAHPGGNTTGISILATELDGKRQDL